MKKRGSDVELSDVPAMTISQRKEDVYGGFVGGGCLRLIKVNARALSKAFCHKTCLASNNFAIWTKFLRIYPSTIVDMNTRRRYNFLVTQGGRTNFLG